MFLGLSKLLSPIYPGILLDSYNIYFAVEDFKEYWVFDTTREGHNQGL